MKAEVLIHHLIVLFCPQTRMSSFVEQKEQTCSCHSNTFGSVCTGVVFCVALLPHDWTEDEGKCGEYVKLVTRSTRIHFCLN